MSASNIWIAVVTDRIITSKKILSVRLRPTIGTKYCGLVLKCVVLLHHSAPPHAAETLWKHRSDVMAHPPYSLVWSSQIGIKESSIHLGSISE
jgi:hypothetical protein